jgi:hypothetical protein
MGRKLFRGMRVLAVLAVLSSASYGLVAVAADDHREGNFEVTVTNLTRGQIISPSVVATHTRKLVPLFTLGAKASAELADVAEDAKNDLLVAALEADPKVKDVQIIFGGMDMPGPIMPGESASVEIDTDRKSRNITVVGMLVTTNDAFFALNGVRGPGYGTKTYYSPAYDAGSEANNEDCAFIPGPPCEMPGVHTDDAEGYVHIHAGIHGGADLVPAGHDWRNPVAKVTIRRLR